jgi:hypothetical protein
VCPICLTSLAITIAATTGSGAAATAFAVRVKRSLIKDRHPETPRGEESAASSTEDRIAGREESRQVRRAMRS